MSEGEIRSARERAAEALGAAMLSAIELTVREYMTGQGEELPPLLPKGAELTEVSAGRNESFDLARFYRLRGMAGEGAAAPAERREKTAAQALAVPAAEERGAFSVQEDAAAAPRLRAEEVSERFERDARRYDGAFRSGE